MKNQKELIFDIFVHNDLQSISNFPLNDELKDQILESKEILKKIFDFYPRCLNKF
jgi:hypothetical protein